MTGASAASAQQLAASLGLPAADQIGFVVRDMDAAMAMYDPLFGPFKEVDFGDQAASYHGGPRSEYALRYAFGRLGDLEIELIQWVSGDTPHRDFIEQGHEGMHHLRFRIDDIEYWQEKLGSVGFEAVWFDRISPDVAYAYLEREGDPLVLELLQFRNGQPPI